MPHKSHPTRCASLAIAATLALGSTPLLAQDVAAPTAVTPPPPTITIPEPVPAAPPPAPTIVIPDELTQPQAAAPASQPTTRTTARPTTTTRAAPSRPAPAPAAQAPEPVPAPDASVADTAPVDAPVAAAPVSEPLAASEPAPTVEQTRSYDNTMAIVLGILAALAVILIGFFALRRKGPKRYAAEAPTIEKPVVARDRVQPLAELPEGTGAPEFPASTPGSQPAFEPAKTQPRVHYTNPGAPFVSRSTVNSALSHSGAAVALPREMPQTYEEREALMQRMVNAAPDRANPFRSKRARMKRARLILASLGQDFQDRDPWIDLSQYPSNWPELARRHSAAA